jgi:aminoglycoside/choline kinase family phosphotransferase
MTANKTCSEPDEMVVRAGQLLGLGADAWNPDNVDRQCLAPDGSQRRFTRLINSVGQRILIIEPPPEDAAGMAEARSAWQIGSHLSNRGVPVPKPYGFEEKTGRLYVEDLGDTRFFEYAANRSDQEQYRWYRLAIQELVTMQLQGAEQFSLSWCWDTPRYDWQLMLERESGYFLAALCRDLLAIEYDEALIKNECLLLAEQAARAPAHFFLHRDFQSRNIMIVDDTIRIIDYQGGRLGPLAYDLASLLLDPYGGLSRSMQAELFLEYGAILRSALHYDLKQFQAEYFFLSLQRTLQMLGAFAFLSHQRGKPFFAAYIRPALINLEELLARPEAYIFPGMRELARQCLDASTQI